MSSVYGMKWVGILHTVPVNWVFTWWLIVQGEFLSRLWTHELPSKDCLARIRNLQPVPRVHVRRFRSTGAFGGSPFRSHANTILTRPFWVLDDLPVENA